MINTQSPQWYELLVRLQKQVGKDSFFPALSNTLNLIVKIDCSGVFFYNGSEVTNIYQGDFSENYSKFINLYLKGLYLLDPHYSLITKGAETGLYHFNDIAPDCFHETKYYNAFIKPVGISDEYDFIVRINNCYVDFFLDLLGGKFSEEDKAILKSITPMITYLIEKHWIKSKNNSSRVEHDDEDIQYQSIFDSFGKSILTTREQEVVQCILHGHSSKSLASKLKISPSTVKTHRKHIYQKLHITTQSELFSLCIQSLSIKGVNELEDPLLALNNIQTNVENLY